MAKKQKTLDVHNDNWRNLLKFPLLKNLEASYMFIDLLEDEDGEYFQEFSGEQIEVALESCMSVYDLDEWNKVDPLVRRAIADNIARYVNGIIQPQLSTVKDNVYKLKVAMRQDVVNIDSVMDQFLFRNVYDSEKSHSEVIKPYPGQKVFEMHDMGDCYDVLRDELIDWADKNAPKEEEQEHQIRLLEEKVALLERELETFKSSESVLSEDNGDLQAEVSELRMYKTKYFLREARIKLLEAQVKEVE